MRPLRYKGLPSDENVFHCISRIVNGEKLLNEEAREIFRRHLWQAAEFSGVELVTYCVLSNHFHVLVKIPAAPPLSLPDGELVRRWAILHPERITSTASHSRESTSPFRSKRSIPVPSAAWLAAKLAAGGMEAEVWRRRLLCRMGDLSEFMKTLKHRFTIWFNDRHQRYGPLWAERFRAILIDPSRQCSETVAAYIDLNPVRAGLVRDPKDYRWSGYGEATGGIAKAQTGLANLYGLAWQTAQARYRLYLFSLGAVSREGKGTIAHQEMVKAQEAGGQITSVDRTAQNIRYFTEGVAMGGKQFLTMLHSHYMAMTGCGTRARSRPVRVEDSGQQEKPRLLALGCFPERQAKGTAAFD